VINAIRKENADIESLTRIRYEDHLWQEKRIQSVANVTAADIAEFLPLAAEAGLLPEIQTYAFTDANRALRALRFESIRGAKVLVF
jgi:propanol-preferring alcohol dehydrogenase